MDKVTEMNAISLEGFYELAYRAYSNVSFRPGDRARRTIDEHEEQLNADVDLLANHDVDTDWYKEKYIRLFTAWLGAKSRCISSMITGPANFPTRRRTITRKTSL